MLFTIILRMDARAVANKYLEGVSSDVVESARQACYYGPQGRVNPNAATTRAGLEQAMFTTENVRLCATTQVLNADRYAPDGEGVLINVVHTCTFGIVVDVPGRVARVAVLDALEAAMASFLCDRVALWWSPDNFAIFADMVDDFAVRPALSTDVAVATVVTMATLRTDAWLDRALRTQGAHAWAHVVFKHDNGWGDALRTAIMRPFLAAADFKYAVLRQFEADGGGGGDVEAVDLLVHIDPKAPAPGGLQGLLIPPAWEDHAGFAPLPVTGMDLVQTAVHVSRMVFWHDRSSYCCIKGGEVLFVREIGSFLPDLGTITALLASYTGGKTTLSLCVTARYSCVLMHMGNTQPAWQPSGEPVLSKTTLACLEDVQLAAAAHPVPLRMFALTNFPVLGRLFPGVCAGIMKHVMLPLIEAAGGRAQVWLPPSARCTTQVKLLEGPCRWDRTRLTNVKEFPLFARVTKYQRDAVIKSGAKCSQK